LQGAGCKLQVAGRESYGGQRAWNELQLKSGADCQLSAGQNNLKLETFPLWRIKNQKSKNQKS
jgi:hypothetical protein